VILVLLAAGPLLAWLKGPSLVPQDSYSPAHAVPGPACNVHTAHATPAKVSDTSGASAALTIFVGRNGQHVQRQSSPLAVQSGTLTPGSLLCTATSDLVRSDGQTLPADQAASWAQVDNDGTHVTVFVVVAPRYQSATGAGGYEGTVSLDDPRAIGADIPVTVNVEYYDIYQPLSWALVAAFGGFIWAWYLHRHTTSPFDPQQFWAGLVLRVAVLLVAAIPLVNAQVLANPAWQGSVSQYITLATLAGAAAIAATPTLRVITSLPGRLGQSATPSAKASAGSQP
jgi:hypothetical protein